jgi:hypothetical protein
MAQEGIATLPMQGMPASEEAQGIGALQSQPEMVPISEKDRYEAVMAALSQQIPDLQAKMQQVMSELQLTPDQVEGLSQLIQFIEQNKDNYPAAIQSLVQQGVIEQGDFPPEYNEEFIIILKMVVYAYQTQQSTPEPIPFRKGGLAEAAEMLRKQGRGGDTILAHINPQEADLLKRMGGSGTINPATGIMEFKGGVVGSIGGALKGAVKGVGSAVKSVVGAMNKVLGPQLTQIALTVGGFMVGGPALGPYLGSLAGAAGAAIGSGIGTYGSGGNLRDVLTNSATAFVGGAYGWQAGALAGGAGTLIKGGTFKDALKTAAISAGTAALMNGLKPGVNPDGSAPMGTDLSQPGTIDANGNFVPSASPATPGSVSAVNPSGSATPSVLTTGDVSAATPTGNVSSPFGLRAGNAPVSTPSSVANQGIQSLNYQIPQIDLSAAPSAVPSVAPTTAGINTLPASSSLGNAVTAAKPQMTLGNIGSNIMEGNFGQALSDTGTWIGQNKGTAAMLALGATGAMGGFKPEQEAPPNLVERTPDGRPATGETYIARDPNRYIVQNLPGVNYNPQGGIDYGNIPTNTGMQPANTVVPTQRYTGNTVPNTYASNPYVFGQTYNFLPGVQTRMMAMGGDVFPPGASVMALNRGGSAQYPRRTGQISGPGTETSDDIPAMLSDGEFVVTAKAVRGIGNGSRREGAKKLYRMMHAMEKKAGGKV